MLVFNKLILFGDSITQYSNNQDGFALAPALQHRYSRQLDVVTRGFSGYNTNHGTIVLRELLKAENAQNGHIKLLSIFMGTNDAATTFQHVPLAKYVQNLHSMVKLAETYNIKVVIVGPGLHDPKLVALSRPEKYEADFSSNEATRRYSDAARKVTQAYGLPFVDLWNEFQKYGGWSTEELLTGTPDLGALLDDGIHYTPQGYRVFYDALVATIETAYPELSSEKLPIICPDYKEIDPENVEESLMSSIEKIG